MKIPYRAILTTARTPHPPIPPIGAHRHLTDESINKPPNERRARIVLIIRREPIEASKWENVLRISVESNPRMSCEHLDAVRFAAETFRTRMRTVQTVACYVVASLFARACGSSRQPSAWFTATSGDRSTLVTP